MATKATLNLRLDEAASLRLAGRYKEAYAVLKSLEEHPEAALLGHQTQLGLPRRLHSAFLKIAKAERDAIRSIGFQYNLVPPPATLNRHAKFTLAERKQITQINHQPVPRTIHQIWIGNKPAPVATEAWQKHAAIHDYAYQLWNDASLQTLELPENPVYAQMLSKGDLPGAVDVARYVILQRFGGIYLDCDWYPVRDDVSFHDLLPLTGLVAMPENIPRNTGKGGLLLANSLIAAPPNHPVFERLLCTGRCSTRVAQGTCMVVNRTPDVYPDVARWLLTLADADIVAGLLPQGTSLSEVQQWCAETRLQDSGLLLAWRSWER